MNKIIVLLLLLGAVFSAKAQKIDSLDLGLRNRLFLSDAIENTLYNFSKNNPFYMSKIPVGFNNISAGLNFDKGNYIASGGSTKTNDYFFSTEGKATLKEINLYGVFEFHKVFEDSTRWVHQTRNTPNAPLYFGSIKYNHYERAVYTFKAIAERNILKNNLPLSFNLDYRIGNHYSNNDPRGDLNDFQLNTATTLAYRFNNLKTGLSFRYGYGRENVNIGYKNGNVKPLEMINWRMAGYGISEEYMSALTYTNMQNRKGLDLNFDYDLHHNQNLMVKLAYLKETDNYVRMAKGSSTTTASTPLLDYNLKTIAGNVFWKLKMDDKMLLINAGYKDESGADFYYPNSFRSISRPDELVYHYNNYIYDLQVADFNVIISKTDAKHNANGSVFLGAVFNRENKQDGTTGNDVSYDRLSFNGGGNFSKTLSGKKTYTIGINSTYSYKLSERFLVPLVNEKMFYKYVLYYDYLYNTSKSASIGLKTEYSFPYKTLQASIKCNVNYIHRIGNLQYLDRTVLSAPGKDLFSSNISLNLYF